MIAVFREHLSKLVHSYAKSRFLVAISGGMDSVVLASMCHELGLDFGLCHVNYHLRGSASDLDEASVLDLSRRLGVKLYSKQVDLSAYEGNIQLEARNQRYAWFEEVMNQEGYAYIMTAHHLDDVAETFLFNIGRGTGIEGALSIPAQNGKIIRPLLSFSKKEITQFAIDKQIAYRDDSSNLSDKYARNYLRHHVLPELKKQNPNFLSGLQNTIAHLSADAHFSQLSKDLLLKEAILETKNDKVILNADTFTKSPFPEDLAYHWLKPYGFSGKQVEDFFNTPVWKNGACLKTADWKLLFDRGRFILNRVISPIASKVIFDPSMIRKVEFLDCIFEFSLVSESDQEEKSKEVAYFHADNWTKLTIRTWQEGDQFQPSGMKGKSKKVKKYFSDEKYSIDQKHSTPVLLHGSEIMWIVGARKDERYAHRNSTEKKLKVVVNRK